MKRKSVGLIFILLLSLSGCNYLVNKFAFYPDRINVLSEEELPKNLKEIFIETDDHLKIQSYFLSNPHSGNILIYFHGNAGNLSSRIPDLLMLNGFGINVLGTSYRGYGKSEGTPSERGIYLDGEAAYQYAAKKMNFSPENIIILGRSIGTAVAINTAQNRNIKGLILITPLTSGKEVAKFAGLRAISSLAGDSFNNIEKIKNIKCPLLVIHGTRDKITPLSMGRAIYQKAAVKKQIIIIHGAGHNDLSHEYGKAYWLPIDKFINNRLPQ